MRRPGVILVAVAVLSAAPARRADSGGLPPRITVEDPSRKNHVITILGANLVMVAGLNRAQVTPALSALDRHLEARLGAGEPAVVYPEVVLSIVKAALLRGWPPSDIGAVLVGAMRRIEDGQSPEMTRQRVVLAIVRNEKAPAVLAALQNSPETEAALR
jgi:hypothetical protein